MSCFSARVVVVTRIISKRGLSWGRGLLAKDKPRPVRGTGVEPSVPSLQHQLQLALLTGTFCAFSFQKVCGCSSR